MFKVIFFLMLIALGFACFGIHASTGWMDETGIIHEPFFLLVIVGYLVLAFGILGLIWTGLHSLYRRSSR